mmetsp:Transcript_19308/g.68242  ORF Transcript_19308/g.68242 Transcript_19308/m.68242 type:complete len:219 (+) Transcript_19308:638-1294(+)
MMPKMKKMKTQSRNTLNSAGMDASMDCTITRMPGIDVSVRSGRRTRNVRSELKFSTPGAIDTQPTTTTTKSIQFHLSARYACLPRINPMATIFVTISMEKMMVNQISDASTIWFRSDTSSLSSGSFIARKMQLRMIKNTTIRSKIGLLIAAMHARRSGCSRSIHPRLMGSNTMTSRPEAAFRSLAARWSFAACSCCAAISAASAAFASASAAELRRRA